MKRFIILSLTALSLLATSCVKIKATATVSITETTGNIYGTITDFSTGTPLENAYVCLEHSGHSTLTNSVGKYVFNDLQPNSYYITATKSGYEQNNYFVNVNAGDSIPADIQLLKKPAYIRLVDFNGNDISYLDFGPDLSVNIKMFCIFNNGNVDIACELRYSCEWISSVSAVIYTISPGESKPVSIGIDRSKLKSGQNSTELFVTSNNGSNVLEIKAFGI